MPGPSTCRVVVARLASLAAPVWWAEERAVRDVAATTDEVHGRVAGSLMLPLPGEVAPSPDEADVIVVETITVPDKTRRRSPVRFSRGVREAYARAVDVLGSLPAADVPQRPDFGIEEEVPPPPPRPAPRSEYPRPVAARPVPPAEPEPTAPPPGALPPDDLPPPSRGTLRIAVRRRRVADSPEDFDRATVDVPDLGEIRTVLLAATTFHPTPDMRPPPDRANTIVIEWGGENGFFHQISRRRLSGGGATELYWSLCDVLGHLESVEPPEPTGVPAPPVTEVPAQPPPGPKPEAEQPARRKKRAPRTSRRRPAAATAT